MKKIKEKNASIFELNGIPQLSKALPLALQHVVAMIVGCVTPVSYTHLFENRNITCYRNRRKNSECGTESCK